MIQAVGAVAGGEQPSLGKVVTHLEESADPASMNLGAVLRSMSEMKLARLCFSPSGGQGIDAAGWTTVFTLAGLTMPDVAVKRDDYSYEQRLSVALLYLVSQFARRLLNGMDRRVPKAIILDEAWAITSTPQGAKLIPEVSRMGRSRNTALILVSQNAGDLLNEQVTNCISGVFAFRSSERAEVANVMALLGIEPSDEHKAALRGLSNGECIFRDLDSRAGRIGIDLISDELRQWLDTNPTRARPGEVPVPAQNGMAHEPAHSELSVTGPVLGEPAKSVPSVTGPAQGEPARSESSETGPAQGGTVQSESEAGLAREEPARSEPSETGPAGGGPGHAAGPAEAGRTQTAVPDVHPPAD